MISSQFPRAHHGPEEEVENWRWRVLQWGQLWRPGRGNRFREWKALNRVVFGKSARSVCPGAQRRESNQNREIGVGRIRRTTGRVKRKRPPRGARNPVHWGDFWVWISHFLIPYCRRHPPEVRPLHHPPPPPNPPTITWPPSSLHGVTPFVQHSDAVNSPVMTSPTTPLHSYAYRSPHPPLMKCFSWKSW